MTYRIKCFVSGGVTGSREAWLKQKDKVFETTSKNKAESLAASNNKEMNHIYSTASFRYKVVEMD
jgi:hypothetical protein